MNLDDFAQQIQRMVERTQSLRAAAMREHDPSRIVVQSLEELRTSIEELTVAEEELREQTSELGHVTAELEQERRRYQGLFAAAPVAYVVTDPGGVVTQVNRVAASRLGGEARLCVGVPLAMFVAASDRGRYYAMVERLRESADDSEIEELHMRNQLYDGWFRCRLHAGVERDAAGQIVGHRYVLIDTTNEERAREADRLGSEAKRKDEFLAMLAHELRNPLAPIRAAGELWRHHGDTLSHDQMRWSIDVVVRQADHLAHLVDDLLDMSRVSHGKIRLRRSRVDLREVVEQAGDAVRASALLHRLTYELPTDPVFVDGDPTRLRQIAVNLIENAIKYTPKGREIVVRVATHDRMARFEVCDEGVGLRAEELETIFGLFSQAPATLTRAEGGLGLGLALVRKLVELHDGSVTAQSDGLGKGSRFIVQLPQVDGPEDAPAPSESQLMSLRGRRILVVDDNVDTAEMLSILLKAEGHEVALAFDGADAMQVFETFAPDSVLLDLGLPDIDGLEVARHLRARAPDVLLVAVTGYGHDPVRARTRESGFDHHLLKPVDLDKLRSVILTARRSSSGASAAKTEAT